MFKRFLKYAVVGLQISMLHWTLIYILTTWIGLWYMFSVILTSVSTSLFGFAMNSIWTWRGHKPVEMGVVRDIIKGWRHPIGVIRLAWTSRFVRYYFVGVLGVLLGWTQTYCYTEYLKLWYIHSSMLGTAVVMTSTFIARDRWIWKNDDIETA